MAGKVVTVSSLDSVRIEVLGGRRAVTIPATFLLDADAVFRHLAGDGGLGEELSLYQAPDEKAGGLRWHATTGFGVGQGDTPWGAMTALARALEAKGR